MPYNNDMRIHPRASEQEIEAWIKEVEESPFVQTLEVFFGYSDGDHDFEVELIEYFFQVSLFFVPISTQFSLYLLIDCQ